MLAASTPDGLAGGLPQPSSHRRAARAEQDHSNVGRVVKVGTEPDEGRRRCYPIAHARGSPQVRRALWTDLYHMRQRQAAIGAFAEPGAAPAQRPGPGAAGIRRATAADHAASPTQMVGRRMSRLSTHVLDTALGRPAAGMMVHLDYAEPSGGWREISALATDDDGRCVNLLPSNHALTPGQYRLSFETGTYHQAQSVRGLYLTVDITVTVRPGDTHLHVPLLLSPT